MLTTGTKYSINFSRSNKKFCLSLHYNGNNSFLFVNNMKKKTGLKGCVYNFSVDYWTFDTSNIINIQKF